MRRLWPWSDDDEVADELAGEAAAAAASTDPTPIVPDPNAAAFFDVDNTLIRGASIYHFARGLAARKLFTFRDLAMFALGQVAFRIRGAENAEHISTAREAALAFVAGRSVDELVSLCEEIYDDKMADRIWHGTRSLALKHLDAGQQVWLVTATPVELARIISHRLGPDRRARHGRRDRGRRLHRAVWSATCCTARPRRAPYAPWPRNEGLDLSRCAAYSDSYNDLPMLTTVGHPHAVNPDGDLRDHARENGWPVHDFRTGRKVTMVALPAARAPAPWSAASPPGMALRRHHRGR